MRLKDCITNKVTSIENINIINLIYLPFGCTYSNNTNQSISINSSNDIGNSIYIELLRRFIQYKSIKVNVFIPNNLSLSFINVDVNCIIFNDLDNLINQYMDIDEGIFIFIIDSNETSTLLNEYLLKDNIIFLSFNKDESELTSKIDIQLLDSIDNNFIRWTIYKNKSLSLYNSEEIINTDLEVKKAINLESAESLLNIWDKRLFDISNSPYINMIDRFLSDNLDIYNACSYVYSLAIDINKSILHLHNLSSSDVQHERKNLIDNLFIKWNSIIFILSLLGFNYSINTLDINSPSTQQNNNNDIERELIIELIKKRHIARRDNDSSLIKEIEDFLLLNGVRLEDKSDGSTSFYTFNY